MKIGPKGQVVIPKEVRDKIGFREGTYVIVDLRGEEVVIRRAAPPTRDYADYFVRTYSKKLSWRQKVNIKHLLEEERIARTTTTGLR